MLPTVPTHLRYVPILSMSTFTKCIFLAPAHDGMEYPNAAQYAENRYACALRRKVHISSVASHCQFLNEGLPQGSMLSSIHYIIYINDRLDKYYSTTMALAFIADLSLVFNGRNEEKVERVEVSKMISWSSDEHLHRYILECKVDISLTLAMSTGH